MLVGVTMMLGKAVLKIVFAVLLFLPLPAAAVELHGVWNELLALHVENGKVDYLGFKADEERLAGYLAQLDTARPADLTEADRLAFYINAYNAYTVKLILEKFKGGKPVKSIKDLGGLFSSPWSIRCVRIGGETMTLDTLEHEIIRPKFKDPRVHFAINCASRSCPPLRSEAYTGRELDKQLDDNAITFLNDHTFNYISGNTLFVSKIFDWFGEDFHDDVAGFVKKYARRELLAGIVAAGNGLKVKYLDYDWSLNSR